MSRYRFIAEEKAHHSVAPLCRVLHVAKSAFSSWQTQQPSARARADDNLINEIKAVHADSRCTYGAPRVHAELRRRGKCLGRKRIAYSMRKAGLVGRCPRGSRQPHSRVRPDGPVHAFLFRPSDRDTADLVPVRSQLNLDLHRLLRFSARSISCVWTLRLSLILGRSCHGVMTSLSQMLP